MKPEGAITFNMAHNISDAAVQDAMVLLGCKDVGDGIYLHVKCAAPYINVPISLERAFQASKANITFTWSMSPDMKGAEWTIKDIATNKVLYSEGY